MYKTLTVVPLLIAVGISTPVQADVYEYLASQAADHAISDQFYSAVDTGVIEKGVYGYPFYSGCCEAKSSCCESLWEGYCRSKHTRMRAHVRHYRHLKGGFGVYSHGGGKGDCGYSDSCGKSSWGYLNYRGLGGKGGCGIGHACGSKGCGSCDPCRPKHCRLGLFDWMHFGRDHGCSVCGDAGCNSCHAGKGGSIDFSPMQGGAVEGYDKSYYGTPTEAEEDLVPQPAEARVEPSSIYDRSARGRQLPANRFARPFSY